MHYIPERWKKPLEKHLKRKMLGDETPLQCGDFPNVVIVYYGDGSFSLFKYAFFLHEKKLKEYAIFTEHSGYHFIPHYEARIFTFNEYE